MPQKHKVVEGEGISKIAQNYGFFWETVWNYPGNAELRRLRPNPELLLPGDIVEVPDKRQKEVACATDSSHSFVLKGVPARLVIRLLDEDGDPRANEPYQLVVDGAIRSGETDGDGMIREAVPPNAVGGTLRLHGGRETYEVSFGRIDPLDTVSGAQSVLSNLGYRDLTVSGVLDDVTRQALTDFQRKHHLPLTGEPDAATAAALASVYMGSK